MSARQERVDHANELIRVIASHGRRFFHDAKQNTYSRFELRNGRLWYIDKYTGRAIYMQKTGFRNEWNGFSDGGRLRELIEDMCEYIARGTPVPRWKIVIERIDSDGLEGNIWAYDVESAQAVRDAAYKLPIMGIE